MRLNLIQVSKISKFWFKVGNKPLITLKSIYISTTRRNYFECNIFILRLNKQFCVIEKTQKMFYKKYISSVYANEKQTIK